MRRREKSSMLGVLAMAVLMLSMTAFSAASSQSAEFTRTWDQHTSQGRENQPANQRCTAWHFVLTSGGQRITSASLLVEFENQEPRVVEGQQSGSQDRGAWHFRFEKEAPDRVDRATATFTTQSGNEGNHVLTLSDADCAAIFEPDDRVERIDLTPEHEVNPLGETHTVTATATRGGEPVGGVDVRFQVVRDGQVVHNEVRTTGEDGTATYSYTHDADADDTIFACTNPDGTAPDDCRDAEGNLRGDVVGDTATKQWREEPPPTKADRLRLKPKKAVNPLGETHTVTATVTRGGEPAGGVDVRFQVVRDGEVVHDEVRTTGEDGTATYDYTHDADADDTIFACTNPDGTAPDDCRDAEGNLRGDVVGDTATKEWREDVEPTGYWTCEARVIELLGLELFGANVDEVECMDDEDELLSLPLGGDEGQPGVLVELARAETRLTDDGPYSRAIVTGAAIRDGDGELLVAAYVLESEAWGSCEDGQPTLDSRSSVAQLNLLDDEPLLDLGDATSIDLLDPLIGTIHLNHTEEETTADGARRTQRALWIEGFPLGDVILAEATADYHGNPC